LLALQCINAQTITLSNCDIWSGIPHQNNQKQYVCGVAPPFFPLNLDQNPENQNRQFDVTNTLQILIQPDGTVLECYVQYADNSIILFDSNIPHYAYCRSSNIAYLTIDVNNNNNNALCNGHGYQLGIIRYNLNISISIFEPIGGCICDPRFIEAIDSTNR